MNTYWKLETNGDPLGAVQLFLQDLWEYAEIEGILVPLRTPETNQIQAHLIDTPAQLHFADPFAPIMASNTATLVAELTEEYPFNSFAAVLRPCELRALVEMVKIDSFHLDRVFIIGVECLSTFPASDFNWRAQRKNGEENLTNEALLFARQGGLVESRNRLACQFCEVPTPVVFDLKISVLGLPVREALLITTKSEELGAKLNLAEITAGKAERNLIASNQRTLEKIGEKRSTARARVTSSLEATLPKTVDELIEWMEGCVGCQECMDSCPICRYIFPEKTTSDAFQREDVIKWLISCADCGMCAQACPDDLPLTTMFGYIRRELSRAYGYVPGQSIEDLPPV